MRPRLERGDRIVPLWTPRCQTSDWQQHERYFRASGSGLQQESPFSDMTRGYLHRRLSDYRSVSRVAALFGRKDGALQCSKHIVQTNCLSCRQIWCWNNHITKHFCLFLVFVFFLIILSIFFFIFFGVCVCLCVQSVGELYRVVFVCLILLLKSVWFWVRLASNLRMKYKTERFLIFGSYFCRLLDFVSSRQFCW